MQRLAPEGIEVRASVLLLPVRAYEVIARCVGLTRKQCNKFHRALAVIQRGNQRLNDTDRAVVSASIAPSLEFVCLVDVPLTELGGFVLIKTKVDAERNLAVFQDVRKIEIGWRVIGWIVSQNNQPVDFASTDVGDEILNRFVLVDGILVNRFGVENSLTDIAEFRIERVRQRMDRRRLMIPSNYHAGVLVRLEIHCCSGQDPSVVDTDARYRKHLTHGGI